jgi:DNA polymerase-1
MIEIQAELGKVRIVEDASELPDLSDATELFMDHETTAFEDYEEAYYPYNGNRICGTAVTVDDFPGAWYVPVRHRPDRGNVSVSVFRKWMADLPKRADWINHGVKFDAHFSRHDGHEHEGRLICTNVLAKLINSDRFTHELKPLVRDWCGLKMEEVDRLKTWLSEAGKGNKKLKDYGRLPIDMCGEYAGMDVLSNRHLYRYLQGEKTDDISRIWDQEILLTPVLYDMEIQGMHADRGRIQRENLVIIQRLITIHERIRELTGHEYVDSNSHIFDLFVNFYGLPVISYNAPTEKMKERGQTSGNPSFDTDALNRYMSHPTVLDNPDLKELVSLISEERHESHFKSLFIDPYLNFMDEDGWIHPDYNQLVRTGRMSCRRPNSQQLNERAMELIDPGDPLWGILDADASQIEFRLIVHYIRDEAAIRAYQEDPNTDFHQWVADQVNVKRGPAKNINFANGYGAGEKKVTSMLAANPDIMSEIGDKVNAMVIAGTIDPTARDSEYRRLCAERGSFIHHAYHERFSSLRRTSKLAMKTASLRGYVRNAFGRRRHLHPKGVHKAFNSVIQGCAMDYIKSRMIAVAPRYNPEFRDAKPFANVHDAIAWLGPKEVLSDPEFQRKMLDVLEEQPVPFRVPFRWDMGFSDQNWKLAHG